MSKNTNYYLGILFEQCDHDYTKLLHIVSGYLRENSNFYSNDNYEKILFESFSNKKQNQTTILPGNKDDSLKANGTKDEANITVSDNPPNKATLDHRILMPTTQSEHPMNVNEASNDMFAADETIEEFDSRGNEAKNGPKDNIKKNSQKKSNDQLDRSLLTEDEDDDDYVPETQCEPNNDDNLEDNDDDYVQVQPETNSYPVHIDQSQNVIRDYDYGLLIGIDATKNNKSNDSINLTTSSFSENKNKTDGNDSEMEALKWNESTDKSLLLRKFRTLNGSASTPVYDNREQSVTPDLDDLIPENNGDTTHSGSTAINRTQISSTPEYLSAKSFSSSKEEAVDKELRVIVDRSIVERDGKAIMENETVIGKKTEKVNLLSEQEKEKQRGRIDKRIILTEHDKNDKKGDKDQTNIRPPSKEDTVSRDKSDDIDKEKNDTEMYEACTQVFQLNERKDQTGKEIDGKTNADPDKNTTDSIYDMLTQALPEERNNLQDVITKMPPPSVFKNFPIRKRHADKLPVAPNKKTIYDMATQEFTPPDIVSSPPDTTNKGQNAGQSPTKSNEPNDDDDDLYAMATQILPELSSEQIIRKQQSGTQQTINRSTPTIDIEQSKPDTPAFCVVKTITNEKIRQANDKWVEKEKQRKITNKWLFNDSSDEDMEEVNKKKEDKESEPEAKIEARRTRMKRGQPDILNFESKRTRAGTKAEASSRANTPDVTNIRRTVSVAITSLEKKQIAENTGKIIEKKSENENILVKEDKIKETDKQRLIDQKKQDQGLSEGTPTVRMSRRSKVDNTEKEPKRIDSNKLRNTKMQSSSERHPETVIIKQEKEIKTEKSRNRSKSNNSSLDRSSTRRSPRLVHSTSTKKGKHQIMFTKIDSALYEDAVGKLGGDVIEIPHLSTVLVTENKIVRTCKILCAFARGIPIVTTKWITASMEKARFLPTEDFLLHDLEAEKRFNFKLKNSLEKARDASIFKGCTFYVTPNVRPTPDELTDIIKCGDGICRLKCSDIPHDANNVYLVSCQEDKKLWAKYKYTHKKLQIINTEAIMLSVMRQKIAFAGNVLSK